MKGRGGATFKGGGNEERGSEVEGGIHRKVKVSTVNTDCSFLLLFFATILW